MIGSEKMDIIAVERVGTVEGGHHSFGSKPGQAVDVSILRLEEIAAIAQILDAQADVFHEIDHKGFEGGIDVACLYLLSQCLAPSRFTGIAGKKAQVTIFQFFTQLFSRFRNFRKQCLKTILIKFVGLVFPVLRQRCVRGSMPWGPDY